MAEVKIKRNQIAAFLNTGTKASPVWSRLGQGITSQTISYNPNVTTEQYIHQESATSSVDSYQVSIDNPLTAFSGEPVFDYVDTIRRARKTGSDAETQVLIVYLYKPSPYPSELNNAVISVSDFGGDAGGSAVLNFTINLNGDPTQGTSVVTNGAPVFTASSASTLTMTSVPADAATAVARTSSIVLTFSNQIQEESIALTTAAGVPVTHTKSWDATKKVLTLTPSASMTASTAHLVVITGVVDIYNQALSTTVVDFTTGT